MSVAQKDGIRAGATISYEDLYRRWEQSNWSAYAIDFSRDREGWDGLTDLQRESALWIYSMFFFGEDSVADNLSPYIDAAPKEEQKYFLATQQVDEARHAVFFHRFFKEVIGAGDDIGSTLAFTEAQLGWGYRNVFARLDRMADELRRDRSLPKFAQAIALYHMVVEATLAQPGQHFIEDYFAKAGTMPGFCAGMENVSRDEQRHIGFGVKVLVRAARRVGRVQGRRPRAPARGHALLPRGLRAADRPQPRVHPLLRLRDGGHLRVRHELGHDQVARDRLPDGGDAGRPPGRPLARARGDRRAARSALLESHVMGEPHPNPDTSPEVQRLYFDVIARSADTRERQRQAVHDPVGLRRRRPVARRRRERLDQGRAGRVAGCRPDLEGELGRLDRDLEGRARPAPRGALAPAALPRLTAQAPHLHPALPPPALEAAAVGRDATPARA